MRTCARALWWASVVIILVTAVLLRFASSAVSGGGVESIGLLGLAMVMSRLGPGGEP